MLHEIPKEVLQQMARLEAIDAKDRVDGTSRENRLRQITPETGRFLTIVAASAPKGTFVEIGTSAGYSGLYLAMAARAAGARLITFEISEERAQMAQETFRAAGVSDCVELIVGDARERLETVSDVSFCFLDAEKEVYPECYELVVPKMVSGALMVADNVISHAERLKPFVERALSDSRVDAVVVPIGRGELLCRRC